MPARKRNKNDLTKPRYVGKILRVMRGIIPDPDLALEMAKTQGDIWESGSAEYFKLRKIAMEVMDSPEHFVPSVERAMYYACIQELYKEVFVRGRDFDTVRAYLVDKYPNVDFEVVDAIMVARLGREQYAYPRPVRRATT